MPKYAYDKKLSFVTFAERLEYLPLYCQKQLSNRLPGMFSGGWCGGVQINVQTPFGPVLDRRHTHVSRQRNTEY